MIKNYDPLAICSFIASIIGLTISFIDLANGMISINITIALSII